MMSNKFDFNFRPPLKKQCLEDPGCYIGNAYQPGFASHQNFGGFPAHRLRTNFESYNSSHSPSKSGRFQSFQGPNRGRYSSLNLNYSLSEGSSTFVNSTGFPLLAPPASNSNPQMSHGMNSLLPNLMKGPKSQELPFAKQFIETSIPSDSSTVQSSASAIQAISGGMKMESEMHTHGGSGGDPNPAVKDSSSPLSAPPLLQNFSDIKISEGYVNTALLGDTTKPNYTNCQSPLTSQSPSDLQPVNPSIYQNVTFADSFPQTSYQSSFSLGPSLDPTLINDSRTSAAPSTLLNFRMRNMAPNQQSSPNNQYTPFMNPTSARNRFRLRMPGPAW